MFWSAKLLACVSRCLPQLLQWSWSSLLDMDGEAGMYSAVGWRRHYVDSHFGGRFIGARCRRGYGDGRLNVRNAAVWGRQCCVDAQLSVWNAVVPVFGDERGVAEDPRWQASTVSTWPPRQVHDVTFNFSSLQSCQFRGVWLSLLPVHADPGKQSEQAPKIIRGWFWESWAPSLLNELKCLRVDCRHESWVSHLGVVPLSHLLMFHSTLRLLGPQVLNLHRHPLAFSMLVVCRRSL